MNSSAVSEGSPSRAEAESAWIELYRNLELNPEDSRCAPKLSKYKLFQRAIIDETLAEIDKRLETAEKVTIWSAGSGIDIISLYLKSVRGDSVQLTLQDISEECMSFNKKMFSRCGFAADFVVGDLFDSKYSQKFDITFNTGRLEHFEASDQGRLLRIFSTSLKPGGVYMTATPFAGAKLYSICKKRNEARGKWKVGEIPIATMVGLESGDLVLTNERQVAASDQLWFFKGAYPILAMLLYPAIFGLRMLPGSAEAILLKLIGGYCILDKFSKNRTTAIHQ